jgi:D-sedoheptulose 7-phosphate isomerase
MEIAKQYLADVAAAARAVDLAAVERLVKLLVACYRRGRTVFVIGNGGSAANASHFAQDLSKGTVPDLEGKRLRALSLADSMAFVTAIANDIGFERVFELQLRQFAAKGDVLVAISGSGNSPNVVRAAEYARQAGLKVVGVTGFDGGRLLGLADIRLHVPIAHMCKAEAVHAILLHMTADLLRDRLAAEGRR